MTLTSPAANATFKAPASIALAATAGDSDGTVANVAFYNGDTLITTLTAAPYAFTWTGVPQGTYTLTARVTDNTGDTISSDPINVTVTAAEAKLYFIEVDHLDTPRLIVDSTGTTVWRRDNQESFNDSLPDENPSGLGVFEFPLGFAGQYSDKETGNWYNGFRDYASSAGRYVQSDPIGLKGGINSYAYAKLDPLRHLDPAGLEAPVKEPPVKPPVTPPRGGPGDGPDCINIPPWSILVSSGGIWGFMRTVMVQCSYYCQPAFCPGNPGDYVY